MFFVFFGLQSRTARGDNVGTALSFITVNDEEVLNAAQLALTKESGMNRMHLYLNNVRSLQKL